MVQGFREGGKWKRRKFKKRADAEAFVALKSVELLNGETRLQQTVTTLSTDEVKQAETAFRRLNGRYTLDEAVEYFLKHFQSPDTEVEFNAAVKEFLDDKQRQGKQPRSIAQLNSTLGNFGSFMEARITSFEGKKTIHVHEVSSGDVHSFLKGLRDRGGVADAKRKTWNNYRLDLSSFFSWSADSNRRYCSSNPVTDTPHFTKNSVAQQRPEIEILAPNSVRELFDYLLTFNGGMYVRYYALLLFAGLRPESEARRLARHPRQNELIDLHLGEIELPRNMAPKSSRSRTITIQPNLKEWLTSFPGEILPQKSTKRDLEKIRRQFGLSPDICRHTWFTYIIGKFDSIAMAAREGGNSEAIVSEHYLSVGKRRKQQAAEFWEIVPLTGNL